MSEDLTSLYNGAVRLFNDFQLDRDRRTIDQAVASFHMAADVTPADHADRGLVLSALVAAHTARFEAFGDAADLDQAVHWGSKAVEATPIGDDNRAGVLTNVGIAYLTRYQYQRIENSADLGGMT